MMIRFKTGSGPYEGLGLSSFAGAALHCVLTDLRQDFFSIHEAHFLPALAETEPGEMVGEVLYGLLEAAAE